MWGYGHDDPGYAEWLAAKAAEEEAMAAAAAEAEAMAELEALQAEAEWNAEQEIVNMLDRLAQLRAQVDLLELDKQQAIESVIPDEIREQIADIEAEFGEKLEALQENISELERSIKDAVKGLGKGVKGSVPRATLNRRVSWDTKRLEGYARAHPWLLEFRRETTFVSIRKV